MDEHPKDGNILGETAPDPAARDITPGWVGRNRGLIEQSRNLGRALMPVCPPPARLALAGITVGADALLLADDLRRRGEDPADCSLRAGGLVLEGAALVAMSRFAPLRLAQNLAGIEAARATLARLRRPPV